MFSVILLLIFVKSQATVAMCPYIDAYWKVDYTKGLRRYSPDNIPEAPEVTQTGYGRVLVRWGHLVMDSKCVDRYILHVWDTKQTLMRYIYNSSSTKAARVSVPMCTKMYIKVEIQEDDLSGQTPDSDFTSITETALTSQWLGDPVINTNRSEVTIDRSHSHWSQVFTASYLKGVFVDWKDLVINTKCVKKVVIVVSRLVKGRLSDHVKTVRVPVPPGQYNMTLALQCEDKLPYNIQVELIEMVSVNGKKKLFAERSSLLEVPLICPWSEVPDCGPTHQWSCYKLVSIMILWFLLLY